MIIIFEPVNVPKCPIFHSADFDLEWREWGLAGQKNHFMSELYTIMLAVLAVLAISGLYVGVTNDAVNFLNAAIGSKVAKMRKILAVASVGIIIVVFTSTGMM